MALDPELIKQLRELKALVDEGLLTEDEFAAKKLLGLPAAPGAVVGMPIVGAVALAPPPAQTAPVARQAAGKVATGVKLLLSDCGSKGVMVTGETMRAKAQLKAMGGRWDSRLTAWMFTGGATVAQLRVDLEARGIAVGEDGGAEDTSPDERRAAELAAEKAAALELGAAASAGATLTVARHKKSILVSGDTNKDVLRALDGKYFPSLEGWCHPGNKCEQILAALRADPTNIVLDDTAKAQRRGKRDRDLDVDDGFVVADDDAFE
ncbi:hypothetical protein T492DRAFT_182496 [Pavlovales sp. CCMP2436]|nr:hypothetical protein T492DRAFT_182496 [Pavlovales sp. CCMP2436]